MKKNTIITLLCWIFKKKKFIFYRSFCIFYYNVYLMHLEVRTTLLPDRKQLAVNLSTDKYTQVAFEERLKLDWRINFNAFIKFMFNFQ